MFRCGVPEASARMHRASHSESSEHTSTSQHKAVSNVLVSPQEVQYKDASKPATSRSGGNGCLTSLVGTASNCVINVNFGSRIDGIKESNVTECVERACSKLEVDI